MIIMRNFKIIFFTIFLTFSCFVAKSLAEVVTKVEVKGNKRISAETILIFGDVIIGEDYESMEVNKLIKKLYDTNYFSNISVEIKDGKMSITVSENPIINSLVFNGEKAKKYTEVLTEFLTLRENTSFLNAYIKSHNLQDEKNKRTINPDDKLRALLKVKKGDSITYFNLQKYMKAHFPKKEELSVTA